MLCFGYLIPLRKYSKILIQPTISQRQNPFFCNTFGSSPIKLAIGDILRHNPTILLIGTPIYNIARRWCVIITNLSGMLVLVCIWLIILISSIVTSFTISKAVSDIFNQTFQKREVVVNFVAVQVFATKCDYSFKTKVDIYTD